MIWAGYEWFLMVMSVSGLVMSGFGWLWVVLRGYGWLLVVRDCYGVFFLLF